MGVPIGRCSSRMHFLVYDAASAKAQLDHRIEVAAEADSEEREHSDNDALDADEKHDAIGERLEDGERPEQGSEFE